MIRFNIFAKFNKLSYIYIYINNYIFNNIILRYINSFESMTFHKNPHTLT